MNKFPLEIKLMIYDYFDPKEEFLIKNICEKTHQTIVSFSKNRHIYYFRENNLLCTHPILIHYIHKTFLRHSKYIQLKTFLENNFK